MARHNSLKTAKLFKSRRKLRNVHHVCCMARSMRSLCQVATMRHGRFAPPFRALGLRYDRNFLKICQAFPSVTLSQGPKAKCPITKKIISQQNMD